jgi:hypothetical protein
VEDELYEIGIWDMNNSDMDGIWRLDVQFIPCYCWEIDNSNVNNYTAIYKQVIVTKRMYI